MKPCIYALADPRASGHIRYVGMAFRAERPYAHAKEARVSLADTHKLRWIRKLQREGQEPTVLILEELPEGSSKKLVGFVEACYIRALREIGHELTNSTAGGDGLIDPSAEVRAKISEATRRGQTPEARQKMSQAAQQRWADPVEHLKQSTRSRALMTPEIRQKVGQAGRGRVHSDETKERMSLAHKGLERTAEHCLHISESRTPEVRARIGEAARKRYEDPAERIQQGAFTKAGFTQESRAKISAAHLGRQRSEETKRRMREAWVRRREQHA